MLKPKAFVDSISSFSPGRESWASVSAESLPEKISVDFKTGQAGTLEMKNPRAVHWARVIDTLQRAGEPVYVEVDEESNIITRVLIPRVYRVESLKTDERGDVVVRLMPSSAIHFLLKSDPGFDSMKNSLQSALNAGTEVLVTETRDEHEIIDVRQPMKEPGAPGDPAPEPDPDPPVSETRAQELYDNMNAESCDPCNPSSSCIPFKYPDDGCWARAHKMCYMMDADGEDPEKVWISAATTLNAPTHNHPDCRVLWGWHVAPTLTVTTPAGDEKRVIDPSLSPSPESESAWKARQGDPAATMRDSAWTEYWGIGTTDPSLTDTDYWLSYYRMQLQDRCLELGPPPYNCTRNCFFIMDRNTFSDDEIEAILHTTSPAVIEDAFYIVVDGFSPYDLGFSSATMQITPALAISPAVSGMTIQADRLVFEYPSHLNRRQRLTWVYNVQFADTGGFTSERITVTLQASLSSVSAAGYIYLIQQPNPYEIDGQTAWLSTDLRVFQIKSGESIFGATMGSNPTAFITLALSNLNSGNTAGQTFENNISTNQQTSRLELSQMAGGVNVYNFAIAKVRYRALSVSAADVRVFFRLFPVATTSLEYDQSTTYRRYDGAGKIIPLLGVRNNEIASIPCFAAPRIDSSAVSMSAQTDPANIMTMPPDAGGGEVVKYFGCWLDINQLQPQFPIQPSPLDGPYPASDRKPIQELIRNEHQCLVSEIAFSPSPAQAGDTPSVSDKLAQRNLAIVESANPGLAASRRIPQTFEIRPSISKTDHDELMIDWRNVPHGSYATIYLPGFDAGEILLLAARKYRSIRLFRIDRHTLKCETGGITYLPIPFADGNFPGMITIDLPEGIKSGQVFKVIIKQVTGSRSPKDETKSSRIAKYSPRHVVGAFQITIPVREKSAMLPLQQRLLSNLRWIEKSIPDQNRWAPVFSRYVMHIADRVNALGGNADRVGASPSGNWRSAYWKCCLLALLTAVLLGILIVVIGTGASLITVAGSTVLILLAGASYLWVSACRPAVCSRLRVVMYGAGVGSIALALCSVIGMPVPQLAAGLLTGIGLTAASALAGWAKRCFKCCASI